MLKMSVTLEGLDSIKKLLSPEKLKKVLGQTINDTARLDVKKDLQDEMKKVFDRPTPYTLNSIYTRYNSADLSVEIGLKEWGGKGGSAAQYLQPQIFGGGRPKKRSEQYLGSYYVPGAGARLNAYGNMSGSQITQILSALKALPEGGYLANITPRSKQRNRKPRNFFMIRSSGKGLRPGVYEKMASGAVKPILIFIRQPSYSIRLRWFEVIEASVAKNVQKRFSENFDKAFRVTF